MKVSVTVDRVDREVGDSILQLIASALSVDHEVMFIRREVSVGHNICTQIIDWSVLARPDPTSGYKASRDQVRSALHSADRQPEPEKVTEIQGEAMSFMLDTLEQAIESTARIMRDEREDSVMMQTMVSDVPLSDLYRRMSAHLDVLLAIQIERLSTPAMVVGATA